MHAPVEDEESGSPGELSEDEVRDTDFVTQRNEDLLEASLEIPSSDQLSQSYEHTQREITTIGQLPASSVSASSLEALLASIVAFKSSCTVVTANTGPRLKKKYEDMPDSISSAVLMRQQLLRALVDLAIHRWAESARHALTLAPVVFELYALGGSNEHDEDEAAMMAFSKVLFVLSKESHNDAAFCNVHYVESALSLLSKASHHQLQSKKKHKEGAKLPMKMLIYIAGTLKNVSSGDERIHRLLATHGAIAILSDTLEWRSTEPSEAKEIAQVLIQTTHVLRNLSTAKSYLKQFNEAQVTIRLCELIGDFQTHQELMVNVSRVLSKLTLHEIPRSQINQRPESRLRSLLSLVDPDRNAAVSFESAESNAPEGKFQSTLLIRIFFVLGNLCAGNDRNRVLMGLQWQGILVFVRALEFYGAQYVAAADEDTNATQNNGNTGECMDVLVKLVRLLANMAINADVGMELNAEVDGLEILLAILSRAHDVGDEELMLNVVSCLTNLSYYCSHSAASITPRDQFPAAAATFIDVHRVALASRLAQIVWDRNEEAVLEATRAFGNLSRFPDVLQVMREHKVLEGFVILLDHSHREIVYTVCGVLMNAALDDATRMALLSVSTSDARALLTGILDAAGLDDVAMSCIAAKALHNLLLRTKDAKDDGEHAYRRYMASEDGAALKRVVQSVLQPLEKPSQRRTDEDEEDEAQRNELQTVLAKLQRVIQERH
ncbi:hypothetical protein Poli38472_011811 [Pythium oligandrum]|uniref:Uncharacterized protein n=1 Tax=Pythium oligandrum TaxID=41045 RepID=A0A8K1C8M7_PYTOL|nr:hypothetical protein Poli38472_011811 [Pythium oligandrum]|eukprot:TMW58223.1 hypothetical protein Poli38472_011811 [Pythium oligandrum]